MSTIPTTFNAEQSSTVPYPSYTVIGGRERLNSSGLSVVLLNRGGRYSRRKLFLDLEKTGFDTVVSVESEPVPYDIDELSERFPFARFLLLHGPVSLGGQINLAVSELDSPLFFVMWNDLRIIAGGFARRMADRLTRSIDDAGMTAYSGGAEKGMFKRLCTVPIIQNSRFDHLPTVVAPRLRRKKIETYSIFPSVEGLLSLYPFDGVGIYDRIRFLQLGGFDTSFQQNYWQLMDFGFRACLWGEEISVTQTIKLSYESDVPVEDTTPEPEYSRFYLKNVAPVFRNDSACLPLSRFAGFMMQSSGGIFPAWEKFAVSRNWINENRFRWRSDARTIVNNWKLVTVEDKIYPGKRV